MVVKATLEIGGAGVYEAAAEHIRQVFLALAARSHYEADHIKRAYGVMADEPPR